jgi:small GTP-binding protein
MCCKSKPKNTTSLFDNNKNETKVVFLGDSGVGKSSLLLRFHRNEFSDAFEVTIGGAFLQTKVELDKGISVTLDVWDTAGQERFRSLMPLYYRQASAAVIVYDVGDIKSFQRCEYWVKTLKEQEPNCLLFLVGNKADKEVREVTVENVSDFAKTHNMVSLETSAKTSKNVQALFAQIAEMTMKNKNKLG